MSIFSLFLLILCVATAAVSGSYFTRWQLARRKRASDQEDRRDKLLRELLAEVKVANTDAKRARAAAKEAQAERDEAQTRLAALEDDIVLAQEKTAEAQRGLDTYETDQASLKDQLASLRSDVASLTARNHELEMELKMVNTGEALLDPALQTDSAQA